MKMIAALFGLFFSHYVLAHHTRDHMMLAEDAGQVIAATREGGGPLGWIVWVLLAVVLLLGFVRWWQRRT